MSGQIARGTIIGIIVGAVVLALAGATLNSIGQTISGLASFGRKINTEELLAWAFKGALVGAISGLLLGIIAGAIFRRRSGVFIGVSVGAVLLALGGFVIGTFRPSDSDVDYKKALSFALIGAVVGAVIGLIIGAGVNYLLKNLQKS